MKKFNMVYVRGLSYSDDFKKMVEARLESGYKLESFFVDHEGGLYQTFSK